MMELHGTITENLRAAIASAERLRGHAVYGETLTFWRELVHEARRSRDSLPEPERVEVNRLIELLELELADRPPRA